MSTSARVCFSLLCLFVVLIDLDCEQKVTLDLDSAADRVFKCENCDGMIGFKLRTKEPSLLLVCDCCVLCLM